MKIGNVSFGATYYEGYSRYEGRNEEFHFEIKHKRPECYLTEKQNSVTRVIENEINKAKVDYIHDDGTKAHYKIYLDSALHDESTDICFRYPKDNVVEAEIMKWGVGSWGDEYCYNPYNKNGDKRIKISFSLDKMLTVESIREKTAQFIADCKAFLTDKNNPKNKEIEDKLWEKC